MTRSYHTSRPAPLTLAERMERGEQKRKAKEQRAQELPAKLEVRKASVLSFDYRQIEDEAQRRKLIELATDIIRWQRRTRDELFRFGQRLLEVKEILQHGQFEKWMDAEFQSSQNTLRHMMNVARVFGEGQKHNVVLLSDTALYLLSSRKVSEEARLAAIKEANEKGRSPSVARIRQIVAGRGQIKPMEPPVGQDGEQHVFKAARASARGTFSIVFSGDVPRKGSFVVYALIDPRKEQVYYVGATYDFTRRMLQHSSDWVPEPLGRRKSDIRDAGHHTIVRILKYANDYEDCRDQERHYIALYYATLVNSGDPSPVPEPEPDDPIEAEYTVVPDDEEAQAIAEVEAEHAEEKRLRAAMNFARDEGLTFEQWLALMPTGLGLREQLAILALAKATSLAALGDHPKLYNAVYGALPTWSQLITTIEKELKK